MEAGTIPTINPNIIPSVAPGRLFDRLTGDTTLNIRWLQPKEPVYYEVFNRPTCDLAVRQLIIAKAVDNLNTSLGHQATYPFLVQPTVTSGTDIADVPFNWIWGINVSLPRKWEKPRLSKIKRISGLNDPTSGYSGFLRLIFGAQQIGSSTETYIFSVDYHIDSVLSYQTARLRAVDAVEEGGLALPSEEAETVAGNITFRTLDTTLLLNARFLDLLAPPANPTDANSNGLYDNPAVYEVSDYLGGGTATTDDYSMAAVSHGTGLLIDSSWSTIPQLDADAQSWINSMNYPFSLDANRTSRDGIRIPIGIFREFNVTAPAGDEPTGASNSLYYPVWVSRAERLNLNEVRLYLSTRNTTETETGGLPSLTPIEFASLTLPRTGIPGLRIDITPFNNLKLQTGSDAALYGQQLGRGHAVLSNAWAAGNREDVDAFFLDMSALLNSPQTTEFNDSSSKLSSFGVSRIPKYTPTVGQGRALVGSTSRYYPAVPPSESNRYVCEQDQGIGNAIDFDAQSGLTPHAAIDRYGYTGALCHRVIKLVLFSDQLPDSDPNFYNTNVLPRLRLLLGRDPIFGDVLFNGTRFVTYNGDTWQG